MTREEHYRFAEEQIAVNTQALQELVDYHADKKSMFAVEPMNNGMAIILVQAINALTEATLANCRVRQVDDKG